MRGEDGWPSRRIRDVDGHWESADNLPVGFGYLGDDEHGGGRRREDKLFVQHDRNYYLR